MTDPVSRISTPNGTFRVAQDGPDNAPVLIFSNSLGTTLEMWEPQVATFARQYRVVRYDTRGHGESVGPHGSTTFDVLGSDVLAIMDALEIESASFCGISMGGHTGLWLAIHAPERFDAIAVCNSAARIGTVEAWMDRANTVRAGGPQAMATLADTTPGRWFTDRFVQEQSGTVKALTDTLRAQDAAGYAACCEALAHSDLRPGLSGITVPMLLLTGAQDPVTTVADSEFMHRAIAGSRLSVLQASHLSNVEAPQAFNESLQQFLRGATAR